MDSTPSPNTDISRIHYLDHVRAWAMLAGVFLHASLTYATEMQEFWFLKDSDSPGFSLFFAFIHLFRMALFFLVAGFFANLLIHKRGLRSFLKNRAIRLALPFVIFLPLIMVAYLGAAFYIRDHVNPDSHTFMFKIMLAGIDGTGEPGRPSTAHLWFVYNLMMFCLVTAVCYRFRNMGISRFVAKIFTAFYQRPLYVLIVPLTLVPALYSVMAPTPAPDQFVPQGWSFGYYGLFFLFGWHFYYHHDFLDRLRAWVMPMALLVVPAFIAYVLFLIEPPDISELAGVTPDQMLEPPSGFSAYRLTGTIVESYLSVFLVFLSLYLARRFLSFENKITRYISDASYWIYIVHVPLLLIVQAMLLPLAWPAIVKFIVSVALVFTIAVIAYELFVRYTPIGTMLNGKKVRRSNKAEPALNNAQ